MRGASAFYIGGAVACTAAARQALTPGCDDALKAWGTTDRRLHATSRHPTHIWTLIF